MTIQELSAVLALPAGLLLLVFGMLRSQIGGIRRDHTVEIVKVNTRIDEVTREVRRVEDGSRKDVQEALQRIEGKIDVNEGKNSNARHDVANQVHTMNLKLEVAIAQSALGKSR